MNVDWQSLDVVLLRFYSSPLVQFSRQRSCEARIFEPMLGVLGERTGVVRGFAHLLFHTAKLRSVE